MPNYPGLCSRLDFISNSVFDNVYVKQGKWKRPEGRQKLLLKFIRTRRWKTHNWLHFAYIFVPSFQFFSPEPRSEFLPQFWLPTKKTTAGNALHIPLPSVNFLHSCCCLLYEAYWSQLEQDNHPLLCTASVHFHTDIMPCANPTRWFWIFSPYFL